MRYIQKIKTIGSSNYVTIPKNMDEEFAQGEIVEVIIKKVADE